MNVFKVTIKTLTPMFSSGSNNREAEFRLTELKALMRTTFREFFEFEDIEEMKTKESELFGSMKIKSPIIFRCKKTDSRIYGRAASVPHKRDKNQQSINSKCIQAEKEIEFELLINNEKSKFYIKLLFLASIIGGLGKRSRKGNGSFSIKEINIINYNEDKENLIKTINELKESNFDEIYSKFNKTEDEYKIYKFIKNSSGDTWTNNKSQGLRFPYTKELIISKINPLRNEIIREKISNLTHERKGDEFLSGLNLNFHDYRKDKNNLMNLAGSGKPRLSSPIYVTFFEIPPEAERYMIIKILNYDYAASKLKVDKKNYTKYINSYVDNLKKCIKG